MRAILNREIPIRLLVDDEDGRLIDADTNPSVSVKDGDGNTVASVSAVSQEAAGTYKAIIPPQAACDRLSVTWSSVVGGFTRSSVRSVDVVSEHLVPLTRLRADGESGLADATGSDLRRIEETVAEWFKSALKFPPVVESYRRAFVLNYSTQRFRVPNVYFPRSLNALTYGRGAGATPWTPQDIARVTVVENGFEWLDSGTFAPVDFLRGRDRGIFQDGAYSVRVTHGGMDFDHIGPNEDVRRAAVALCRYVSRTNNLPERARRIETQQSIIDLSMPSPDKPTGLPDVDAVIARYRIQAL